MSETESKAELLELTASVVSAYVTHNNLPAAELTGFIASTYSALINLGSEPEPLPAATPVPAVPIRRSVTPDAIICLEDGKKFKSLKRHLRTSYDMSPEQYRLKWGLPVDYPMVAPTYAEARSALAKSMGLGRKPADAPAAEAKPTRRTKTSAKVPA